MTGGWGPAVLLLTLDRIRIATHTVYLMTKSDRDLNQLKRLIPQSVKRVVRSTFERQLKQQVFRRAMRQLMALPVGVAPTRQLLADLQRGWGNESFAARTDYLEEVSKRAVATQGPILECGSGLTTILLGSLAGRRGIETWSLEHMPDWHARVSLTLRRNQIPKSHVCLAPLREYSGFSWYDPPLDSLPANFHLVICDGPPGTTLGNRYGLMPVLGNRLPINSVILLDDVNRAAEAEVLQRWTKDAGVTIQLGATGSFAIVTRC